ncbi:uncharacterized protein LOC122973027 [Scomber scombrus]|uniref:Uncharacterized protein LOC122973027 n=1 Tax=Scomber scombrus TaxID=13677 RepID=A0AAV1QA41_SCOSC
MKTFCLNSIVNTLLVAFLSVFYSTVFVTGASHAVCPTQPVEVVEDGVLTLQCRLEPQIDVSARTTDWKRLDLDGFVYSYRHKQDNHDAQMERYRGRTAFDRVGLSEGNLTLKIYSVQLNDSGQYRCYVPKLDTSCVITVKVVPKGQQMKAKGDESRTTRIPLDPDDPGRVDGGLSDGKGMKIVLGVVSFIAFVSGIAIGVVVLKRKTIQASHAVCPTQPIKAVEDGYVTLQCWLDPPIDVSARTSDWRRLDLNGIVYAYRDGQDLHDEQMERYKGRTTLIYEDLIKGNLTLKISSVQLNDSGQYRCYVPKLDTSCVMNVRVVPKDQLTSMKKGEDHITTRPPVYDVTETEDHDAAETRTHYLIAFPVFGFVVVFIGVLVKKRWRGEEAMTKSNNALQENRMNEKSEEGKNPGSIVINIQQDA